MKKILAIICAGGSQLPLVNKAKEMGIETHCFAWDKEGYSKCKGIADYFHPISILEKEQILEKCKDIEIDGVTSVNNDYAVPTVAFVAQGMGLTGNRYEDMLIPGNKFTMRQAFSRNGVKSPQFVYANEESDLTDFQFPVIVKPVDRRSSIGVIKVERKEDLQAAIQQAIELSYCKEAIIEEFITGVEASVDTISYHGKHYFLGTKDNEYIKWEDHFLLLSKHYPSRLSPEIQEKMKVETIKVLDAINFRNGASNTQFIITKDGEVFSLEITPRLPGNRTHTNIILSTGYDIIKGVIDVALDQFEEPVFTDNKYSGLCYLCKETEWAKQVIENKENDSDIVEAAFYGKDEPLYGGRSGYFIYQSNKKRRWN